MTVETRALVSDDTVLLHHEGAVDKTVVLDTLAQMEDILEAEGIDRQKKRKLVNIAIETLQNLQLHAYDNTHKEYAEKATLTLSSATLSIIWRWLFLRINSTRSIV